MDITVPSVGESIHEALLTRWHRQSGDTVSVDDILCELETDKITLEIRAEAAGTLNVLAGEGETVRIGQAIARIDEAAEEGKPAAAAAPAAPVDDVKRGDHLVSPSARKGAREATVPPVEPSRPAPPAVTRTGEPPEPPKMPGEDARTVRRPMTPIRRAIADRLVAARRDTASLTTFAEADMTSIRALRARHKEHFRQKFGVPLGFMSFFVKGCVAALKEFPDVNARIDGGDIVEQHFYDIGIAIGAEKGLVVPVLRDADGLSFPDIERRIKEMSEKAAANRLQISDLQGGTFTITNGGVYGSLMSTPMLNHPQCAVLGMHAVQERPVARDGQVVIRPMMYLALTYDHRLIDGRTAVEFLKRVKELVEEPEELFLEV